MSNNPSSGERFDAIGTVSPDLTRNWVIWPKQKQASHDRIFTVNQE
jgi:hypothetical protein